MLNWSWTSFSQLNAVDLYEILRLRAEVFVLEQSCVYLDPDGLDQSAWHLQGRDQEGLALYCRLLAPGQRFDGPSIGRVVSAPRARGKGYGHELMRMALEQCRLLYPRQAVSLSAQAHLHDFYAAHGFCVEGRMYMEDGIPHLHMLRLATEQT